MTSASCIELSLGSDSRIFDQFTLVSMWCSDPSGAKSALQPKIHTSQGYTSGQFDVLKGCRMGRSDKVSLLYVSLLINTRFRFFILE